MIDQLRYELNQSSMKIKLLTAGLARATPFSEKSLHNDEYVKFYTGLPNFAVLKSVFDLVVHPVP